MSISFTLFFNRVWKWFISAQLCSLMWHIYTKTDACEWCGVKNYVSLAWIKIKYWWSQWRYFQQKKEEEKYNKKKYNAAVGCHYNSCKYLRARNQSFVFDRTRLIENTVFFKPAIMKASHQTLSVRSWSLAHPVACPQASTIHLPPHVRGACFVMQPVKLDKWHYRVTITPDDEISRLFSCFIRNTKDSFIKKAKDNVVDWLV